jgi:peptide deformylase
MILPIYTYNDPILSLGGNIIDLNDPLLPDIIKNLDDTLNVATPCVAINGPIVGINKRVFIMFIDDYHVFINPKIIKVSKYVEGYKESCLSYPGHKFYINRPISLELEWYDENKEYHTDIFYGIDAKLISHQMDHLDGILPIQRVEKNGILKDMSEINTIFKKITSKKLNKDDNKFFFF